MNKRVECPGAKKPFKIVSIPIPPSPKHGMVIKNHYSGICHSDLHLWQGIQISDSLQIPVGQISPEYVYPVVYGHEMAGEVYSLGAEYKGDLAVGDRVVVYPWATCQDCDACKAGEFRLCKGTNVHKIDLGKEGGFQHYTPIEHEQRVLKVPGSIPLEAACLLVCSGITSYRAVMKLRPVVERAIRRNGVARVLFVGGGGWVMWAIQWARALLPTQTKIIIAATSQEKIHKCISRGADEGVVWDLQSSYEALVQLTKLRTFGGVDASIDFIGIPTTSAKAVACTKKDGICVIVGIRDGVLTIPTFPFVPNVTVEGSSGGSVRDMENVMHTYLANNVKATEPTLVKPEETTSCLENMQVEGFRGRYIIDWTKE